MGLNEETNMTDREMISQIRDYVCPFQWSLLSDKERKKFSELNGQVNSKMEYAKYLFSKKESFIEEFVEALESTNEATDICIRYYMELCQKYRVDIKASMLRKRGEFVDKMKNEYRKFREKGV